MFQLPDLTALRCTNANPRVEFHGEEQHRAIDLTFEVKGENTLLDAIAPCGLAAMGEVHIQLFAPPELVPVRKGWRSGKADAPPPTDNGAPLLDGAGPGDDDHDEDDTGDEHPEGTPEAALAATESEPPRRRGRRAALSAV